MQPEEKREVSVYHKSSLKRGSLRTRPMEVSTAWRKMSIWTSVGSSRKRGKVVAAKLVVVGVEMFGGSVRVRLSRPPTISSSFSSSSSSLDDSRFGGMKAGPSFQPWLQMALGGCSNSS